MEFFKILLLTTVIILSTACERKLKYDGDDNNSENITLTVMASPDTTLEVMAGRSFVFTRLTDITEDAEYVFNISASLRFGHVYYSINGGEQKKMTYDDEHHRFVSDYRPSVGDHIAVNASEIDLPNVSGSTIVPSKPTLEVVDAKYVAPEEGEVNGKAEVRLRISDPQESGNYYRLQVKTFDKDNEQLINDKEKRDDENYNDVFTSDDETLFKDTDIYAKRGNWPRYFSNIFSDQRFNGTQHKFTINIDLVAPREQTKLIVELQSITKELYFYLKSLMVYSITPQDEYTEAIQIYSNVTDGWGIVGAVNTDRHVIIF